MHATNATQMEPATIIDRPVFAPAPTPKVLETLTPAAPWPEAPLDAGLELSVIAADKADTAVVGGALIVNGTAWHGAAWRTTDGGRSWQTLGPALFGMRCVAAHLAHNRFALLYQSVDTDETTIVLAISVDNGASWQLERPLFETSQAPPLIRNAWLMAAGGEAVLDQDASWQTLLVNERWPDRQEHWISTDGRHWRRAGVQAWPLGEALGALAQGRDGSLWRIVDDRIEHLPADAMRWQASEAQPADDYAEALPLPAIALR